MGVRILHAQDHDSTSTHAILYCSTTDWAFGPVFYDSDTHDSYERAQAFLEWLRPSDAREFTDLELESKYTAWLAQEEAAKEKETNDE